MYKGGFNGFGGGGNNMQALMRQAQKMQDDLKKAQEELADTEVEATSGGGMVTVVMTCDRKIQEIKIKPEAVDPDDVEMLEDLIMAAINECMAEVEKENERVMGPITGGMGGLF